METNRYWSIVIVLLSIYGTSETTSPAMSTMEMETVTMFITDLPPTSTRTPPPPPPPTSPPPPPTFTTPEPPPPTTRLPPPPPPPSPPPPPPSSMEPPSTSAPPTERPTTMRMFTTTVAMPTTPTEPKVEPSDPTAIDNGLIGILLNVAVEEFDPDNFGQVIANEVNRYCSENNGACKGGTKTVTASDVVIVKIEAFTELQSQQAGGSRRKLLATQTLVEYYVKSPTLSSDVMLTTEEQRKFLEDKDVAANLEESIGFAGIAPGFQEPYVQQGLEGWEIALIVIGAVAAAAIFIGAILLGMNKNKKQAQQKDLELQETIPIKEHMSEPAKTQPGNDYTAIANGSDVPKKKLPVDETNVSTQVRYKDIVEETGYEPSKKTPTTEEELKPIPNGGGTSMVVTAEISSSSSSSTSSQHEAELVATADDSQEIPPTYETPAAASAEQPSKSGGETKKVEDDVAAAVGELDNLIADQTGENEHAYENPSFTANTEVDEMGVEKTSL